MNAIEKAVNTITGKPPAIKVKTLKRRLVVTISDIKEIYKLRDEGHSQREIAEEMSLSLTCVQRYLKYGELEKALEALYE